MNAPVLFPVAATIWVIWCDNAGLLPALTTSIPCDDIARWRRFGPAKLMELFRVANPMRTVLWADWAERPQDFRFFERRAGQHVLLLKTPGEVGEPL